MAGLLGGSIHYIESVRRLERGVVNTARAEKVGDWNGTTQPDATWYMTPQPLRTQQWSLWLSSRERHTTRVA